MNIDKAIYGRLSARGSGDAPWPHTLKGEGVARPSGVGRRPSGRVLRGHLIKINARVASTEDAESTLAPDSAQASRRASATGQ